MTDHLEPYRRMARSIRFFPPSALTLKQIPEPVTAETVVDSWTMKSPSNADVKSIEPPINLSEQAAALVHEAVGKPTVLPATYVIPENIGDRISRLVAAPSADLALKPNLPQSAPNGTTAHDGDIASNSDRLVYDPIRQVYALESTIVAETAVEEPIAEAETVVEEPIAEAETVVEEPIAEAETVVEEPIAEAETVVEEPIAEAETVVEEPIAEAETVVEEPIAEAETVVEEPIAAVETVVEEPIAAVETVVEEPPNLLEKVSSVIEAVSDALETEDLDDLPNDVEMSLFDHLEELRGRLFYALIAVLVGIVACFLVVKPIVQLLEVPAQGVKFLQLAPGEYFFVSIKVAGYSGILLASPFILYQIIQFVLPGLTRRERRLIGPVVLGSSILFFVGLGFAYIALVPAALNFFISYGADVVEQLWSIEKYFEFVLLLMFSTGLAFQIPIIQLLLGYLGIVSSKQMLSGWRVVIIASTVLGAVLTPSTDPLTQSLLAGAVLVLYFGGIGMVKLTGK